MTGPLRRPAVMVGAVVVGMLTAGCGGGVGSLDYTARVVPPEPSTTTSIPLDMSGASESKVEGSTTTTSPLIGPGGARITGTVIGPSGPVANATVQAERIVDGASASTRVTSGADGSFAIPGILGGIWRVRAWQAPTLDLTTPDIFFLGTTEDHVLDLTLMSFANLDLLGAVAPATALVGQTANLEVQATVRTVSSSGVVGSVGQGGRIVTVTPGSWTLLSANPATTDGNGRVLFQLMCTAPGPSTFTFALADGSAGGAKDVNCVTPAPPTTTTTAPPGFGGSTTTSPPGSAPPPSVP